jgi:hypothetical protein
MPVRAGDTFYIGMHLLDACGNVAAAHSGVSIGAKIYGPVPDLSDPGPFTGNTVHGAVPGTGEVPMPEDGDFVYDLTTFLTFYGLPVRATPLWQKTDTITGVETNQWITAVMLTRAGKYAVRVELSSGPVQNGVFEVRVTHSAGVSPSQTSVDTLVRANKPLQASGFTWLIRARDVYGNDRTVPGGGEYSMRLIPHPADNTSFPAVRYMPFTSKDNGPFEWSNFSNLGDGRHAFTVAQIKTTGPHEMAIHLEGEHIHGSPFSVHITGGMMDPTKTYVTFSGPRADPAGLPGTLNPGDDGSIPVQIERGQAISLYASKSWRIHIHGRDGAGSPTRAGIDAVTMTLVHDAYGDLTPSAQQLAQVRMNRACTYSNYGDFCEGDAPLSGIEYTYNTNISNYTIRNANVNTRNVANQTSATIVPVFAYEMLRDADEYLTVQVASASRKRCRSASGYDLRDTLWDNSVSVPRIVTTFEKQGNITVANTTIQYELHPYIRLSALQCTRLCVRLNCSCATHVTGTYRNGTCIIMNGSYIIENDISGSLAGYQAIYPTSIDRTNWYDRYSTTPITASVYAGYAGFANLSVLVQGMHVLGSPFRIRVMPGPDISVNHSYIVLKLISYQQDASSNGTSSGGSDTWDSDGRREANIAAALLKGRDMIDLSPIRLASDTLQALAGFNYSLLFTVRDRWTNNVSLDSPWRRDDANMDATLQGSAGTYQGRMLRVDMSTLSLSFSPRAAGTLVALFARNGVPLTRSTSLPDITIRAFPTYAPGGITRATMSSKPLCAVPCNVSITFPPDIHDNPSDVTCGFYAWNDTTSAYHAQAVPLASTSSVQPANSTSASSAFRTHTYTLTRDGQYQVLCVFVGGGRTPGGNFNLTVKADVPLADNTLISGTGFAGAVRGIPTYIYVTPRDRYGNIVACSPSDVNISITPEPASLNISDGVLGSCVVEYVIPPLNLTVLMEALRNLSNSSDSNSSNMTINIPDREPDAYKLNMTYMGVPIAASKPLVVRRTMAAPAIATLQCYASTLSGYVTPLARPCSQPGLELTSPATLSLWLQLTDIDGLVANTSLANVSVVLTRLVLVCMCVCVCMYVCICCGLGCLCVCMFMFYACVCVYVCMYVSVYVCMHVCMCLWY